MGGAAPAHGPPGSGCGLALEKILKMDRMDEFEIGRILHLKSEIRNLRLDCPVSMELR
jgi:hypothetical protein